MFWLVIWRGLVSEIFPALRVFFSLRIFRIRHEKLSEGCIHGSAKRSSQTGHRNYQAEKGGYAISYSSGKKAYIHKITCSPSKFGGFYQLFTLNWILSFLAKRILKMHCKKWGPPFLRMNSVRMMNGTNNLEVYLSRDQFDQRRKKKTESKSLVAEDVRYLPCAILHILNVNGILMWWRYGW
jgi:hypothetical protein